MEHVLSTVAGIRTGGVDALQRLLDQRPGLATARIHGGRTALHVVTDWLGNYPNSPAVVNGWFYATPQPRIRPGRLLARNRGDR